MPVDETNYNTYLAKLLAERMPRWEVRPQSDQIRSGKSAKKPDVVAVPPGGVPVVIEAKFAKPASNIAHLEKQALGRISKPLDGREISSVVAVLYPAYLKKTSPDLRAVLERASLEFAVFFAGADGAERFPRSGWLTGGLDRLADLVEMAAEGDHRVAELTEVFSEAVADAARILNQKFPAMAEAVKQEPGEQTDQMMASLILNALIFHYQVAAHHKEINPPGGPGGAKRSLLRDWAAILEINYWPIFKIASDLLATIDDEAAANRLLERLLDTASEMASEEAHITQNLAGHVFGTLLADRKFLASFYTLPAPAAMLAELAVERLDVDWGDAGAVGNLKVADFACGSGSLLSAVYQRIRSRVRRAGLDDETIHRRMLEEVFVGCDIMPAGVHITAAALSSVHPKIDYTKTETHVMPIGPYGDEAGGGGEDGFAGAFGRGER